MGMKKCIIHNGRFAYFLIVDGQKIALNQGVDYFKEHYKKLGYVVEETGNGDYDYGENPEVQAYGRS